jgi:hypothetical protein
MFESDGLNHRTTEGPETHPDGPATGQIGSAGSSSKSTEGWLDFLIHRALGPPLVQARMTRACTRHRCS